MKDKRIKLLTLSGLLAAIIFILTAYIHIPSHNGYTHIGDAFIYLASSMLPMPYAIYASAIGACLADVLSGYAIWAPATIVVKIFVALLFTNKKEKIICRRNIFALFFASIITFIGYYLYEALFISNFVAALLGITGYLTQSVLSGVVFVILGQAFDKLNIRSKLLWWPLPTLLKRDYILIWQTDALATVYFA